ncbi:MAG: hypothetical protein HC854_08845 [Flavobacterium sp.]|nr:hypothetical protein [Flavobacterium sp.]
MKKTIIILLTAIIYSGNSFSQKKIDRIFDKENYHSVIKLLKDKEVEKGLNITENELIALAYYYNNDYNSAYPYFKK